jgi:GNAT superfamily N-acetyltransferase
MTAIRVRRARAEDAAAVSAFGLALAEDEKVPGRRFTPEAVLRDGFGAEPRFIAFVAERGGVGRKLVAALAAEARRQGRGHLWWTSLPQRSDAREFYKAVAATSEQLYAHALGAQAFRKLADEAE